jgi:hypothetical protein
MSAVGLLTTAFIVLVLAGVICKLTVVIQMFMHEEIGLALIGLLICEPLPFFYGWAKANEWDNVLLMITWTVSGIMALVVGLFLFPAFLHAPM